ncbi:hypothetical protein [Neolewinella agarilytica]|uniref:Uncharacterized protein n=1 Tax=Neolewinella agarilytica TaxID=478744 RepID=A0A1H9LXN9_9BACT|nr:hypothetical protein [Neolewinella agarilytica]SER16118.1 hypothetical protein SAMN05444359_12624 [Neolewinella agarilytica]
MTPQIILSDYWKKILANVAKGGIGAVLVVLVWGYTELRDQNRLDYNYQIERAEVREAAYQATISTQSKELKALQKGFAFLSSARRSSPLPEWAKFSTGHYNYKNRAFDLSLAIPNGINPDSILFRTDLEIWPDKDLARTYRENDLKVLTEDRVIYNIEYSRMGDKIIAWHSWKYPLKDQFNNTTGVGGIAVRDDQISEPQLK